MTTKDPRHLELLDWSAVTGQPLPRPSGEIIALEDAGHVVDLLTGDIFWHEAEQPQRVTLTTIGEATLIVMAMDDSEVTQ
jgi:hypothetical protein